MRKLYLFLTFLLTVTSIISLMVASAGFFEGYEQQARLERLNSSGERVPAIVVQKQMPLSGQPTAAAPGTINVELRAGVRRGDIIAVPVDFRTLEAMSEGDVLTVVVDGQEAMVLSSEGSQSHPGLAAAIFLLSLAGVVVLVRRIKQMPEGSEEKR